MTNLCGPGAALASPSVPPVDAAAPPTSGICGRSGSVSSASADLQRCLASRLKQRLDSDGSTLFSLTWKQKVTPAGRRLPRLVASARRTSDSDCGSWPTASARDWKNGKSNQHGKNARPLNEVATLAGWGTPNASAPGGTPQQALERKKGLPCGQSVTTLDHQVQLLGPTSNGFPASTGSGGQLNPAFALWLMGFPAEWESCAPQAMRSCRKRQPSSSGPRG